MSIGSEQASAALSDIETITRRVRQSRFYGFASLMLIWWGVLVALGYVASDLWPRGAGYIWIGIDIFGIAGSVVIGAFDHGRRGVRSFDTRMLLAVVIFMAFGVLWTVGLVHLTPRQLSAFWPSYIMLVYCVVGLWIGPAFVAIGVSIIALTLIGYFYAGPWFNLWMAVVNGGGLILGGLWMRRN